MYTYNIVNCSIDIQLSSVYHFNLMNLLPIMLGIKKM